MLGDGGDRVFFSQTIQMPKTQTESDAAIAYKAAISSERRRRAALASLDRSSAWIALMSLAFSAVPAVNVIWLPTGVPLLALVGLVCAIVQISKGGTAGGICWIFLHLLIVPTIALVLVVITSAAGLSFLPHL